VSWLPQAWGVAGSLGDVGTDERTLSQFQLPEQPTVYISSVRLVGLEGRLGALGLGARRSKVLPQQLRGGQGRLAVEVGSRAVVVVVSRYYHVSWMCARERSCPGHVEAASRPQVHRGTPFEPLWLAEAHQRAPDDFHLVFAEPVAVEVN
jgi:hypothetical protein